jgi:hypothetical protein
VDGIVHGIRPGLERARGAALGLVLVGLLAVVVGGCGGGPDLDKSVAGDSTASIRDHIVAHKDWGEKLSAGQLDQLAAFIAEYAGHEAVADQDDPGLALWKANGCGACHILAAGADADR